MNENPDKFTFWQQNNRFIRNLTFNIFLMKIYNILYITSSKQNVKQSSYLFSFLKNLKFIKIIKI